MAAEAKAKTQEVADKAEGIAEQAKVQVKSAADEVKKKVQ